MKNQTHQRIEELSNVVAAKICGCEILGFYGILGTAFGCLKANYAANKGDLKSAFFYGGLAVLFGIGAYASVHLMTKITVNSRRNLGLEGYRSKMERVFLEPVSELLFKRNSKKGLDVETL